MKVVWEREKGDHWWSHVIKDNKTHSVCQWCGYDTGPVVFVTTERTKNIPLCSEKTKPQCKEKTMSLMLEYRLKVVVKVPAEDPSTIVDLLDQIRSDGEVEITDVKVVDEPI